MRAVTLAVIEHGAATGHVLERSDERAVRGEEGLIETLSHALASWILARAPRRDIQDHVGVHERGDELLGMVGAAVRAARRAEPAGPEPVQVRRHPAGGQEEVRVLLREED